jgi:hypothetical protein
MLLSFIIKLFGILKDKIKTAKIIKFIKIIFEYYYCLLELLRSFSPPLLVLQRHYPRRTSIRFVFQYTI